MKRKNERQLTHNDEYVKYRYNNVSNIVYEVRFIYHRNFSETITMSSVDNRLTRYFGDYSLAEKYVFSVLSHRNLFWTAIITSFKSQQSLNIFRKESK